MALLGIPPFVLGIAALLLIKGKALTRAQPHDSRSFNTGDRPRVRRLSDHGGRPPKNPSGDQGREGLGREGHRPDHG